jgi:hypothetical protein
LLQPGQLHAFGNSNARTAFVRLTPESTNLKGQQMQVLSVGDQLVELACEAESSDASTICTVETSKHIAREVALVRLKGDVKVCF